MEEKLTVVAAAEKLLDDMKRPLHYREISDALVKAGVIKGNTPHLTVCARISKHRKFIRVAEGVYALSSWKKYKPVRFAKDIAYDVLKKSKKPISLVSLGNKILQERKFATGPALLAQTVLKSDKRFYYDEQLDLVGLVEWKTRK